jgi:hypothetical protein
MTAVQVRAYLALGVVGVSMLVVAIMGVYPMIAPVDHSKWADVFGKMVSPFTGLVGVIVGYYFGQKD